LPGFKGGNEKMSFKVKSGKRSMSWTFIIVFLLGAVFAELTADPISDLLFFARSSGGPLSPMEQVIYWYFYPALVYAGLLGLAVIVMQTKTMKPQSFKYAIVIFAGISLALSWKFLGGNPIILIMLLVPFIALVYILNRKITLKHGRKTTGVL